MISDLNISEADKPKQKFPREKAMAAVREILREITGHCARIVVAGSLRRRKEEVGDIEIVYIPAFVQGKSDDFFEAAPMVNCMDHRLLALMEDPHCLIQKRQMRSGQEIWGDKNKFAVHVRSGIPVDFFETTAEAWWGYLVCRTGSAENNVKICNAAIARGMKWHPYQGCFSDRSGGKLFPQSEEEVFALAGLPYLQPWER